MLRQVELRRPRRQCRRGDFPGVVPPLGAGDCRRRARAAADDQLSRPLLRTSRASCQRCSPPATSPWCDNIATPARETCDDIVTTALHDGRRRSAAAAGDRHVALAMGRRAPRGVSAPGARLGRGCCGRCSAARCRTAATGARVNVGPVAAERPYEQQSVPGYRQIVDLSPANDSRFLDAVGQSGHFLSPHYDDLLADWQAVRHHKMRMDRAAIDERGDRPAAAAAGRRAK